MPLLKDLLDLVYENLAKRMTLTRPIGLTTGLHSIDEAVGGGLIRQQLSYLVGRSGIGKSWLTSWFVLQGAKALSASPDNTPVSGYLLTGDDVSDLVKQSVIDKVNKQPIIVFWSLEMAEFPVTVRLLSQYSSENDDGVVLDSKCLLRGQLGDNGDAVKEKLALLYDSIRTNLGQYIFLEFSSRSIQDLRKVLDMLAITNDIVLVAVDYFRLVDEMALDGSRTSIQEVRSAGLRQIARDYDCHVISIFDLNREGEKVDQPHAYHMRDGVAARYDADIVVTLGLEEGDEGKDLNRHLVFNVEKARFSGEAKVDLMLNLQNGYVEDYNSKEVPVLARGCEEEEITL